LYGQVKQKVSLKKKKIRIMNKFKTILGAAIFGVLSLNVQAKGDCPSLSGEYTIGEGGDFTNITEAVTELKCGGLGGPVTFFLKDGTYDEKIVLGSVAGMSAFNSITFASESGNNTEVVVAYDNVDATLTLNGVSNINFENITLSHKAATYGNVAKLDGKCNNIKFKSVVFDGVESSRTGANSAVVYSTPTAPKTNIIIEDCEINNGSVGIFKGGMNAEQADSKTSITGTLFFNQYESSLALSNETSPIVTNNVFSSLSNYQGFKAISLESCTDNIIISNNIVNAANGSVGLAMNNCTGKMTDYGQINNNSIAVGGSNDSYGVLLTGTTDNQVLNYNRVKLTINGTQASNQAYYKNAGTGQNVNLMNNIFYDLNTGGYTILGNTYKDFFNQLPGQSNPALSVSANGIMIEKVQPTTK
jgi:hypothetical protein